jgi:acetoacetyl-CoA synthetase
VKPFWTPSPERIASARLTDYTNWLGNQSDTHCFTDYQSLWNWSVNEPERFWHSVWKYFDIDSPDPLGPALLSQNMIGARWFPANRVNYVSQVFRHSSAQRPAILFAGEVGESCSISWAELEQQVASLAKNLRRMGVTPGDRVAAFLGNRPEAVVAFLACASIGAIWSICSPDMGAVSVLDRFQQIEPKVLIGCDGYRYGGKMFDRLETITQIRSQLPSVEQMILVPVLGLTLEAHSVENLVAWDSLISGEQRVAFEWLPFDHPLWVVYSSGTTGKPKPIVHGHGGILLAMSVSLGLHNDLGPNDRYHWYSTTGWIMWNCQVGGLLVGSTICLFDGNPGFPDMGALWRFAGDTQATLFGAGAAFYASCLKAGINPNQQADLSALRSVGSTGSPLSVDCYHWIDEYVGNSDVWLAPMSGGTDLAGPFIAGNPTEPVYLGEMQCRVLGASVYSFDDAGNPVTDEVGELVCTAPMPCMPLYFWNDPDNQRYLDSYYDVFPGVWRHGDWMRITPRGGVVIYGRSDATINRHGIRMGTSELYQAVESLPEVIDSMVVDLEFLDKPSYMPLFIVLNEDSELTDELRRKIISNIRVALTARHVPDDILVVPAIPRTLSGKKLELPIKKIMLGHAVEKVINPGALANPECLSWYLSFSAAWLTRQDQNPLTSEA